MSNKYKSHDKSNKITDIDDHIRRSFDIHKVHTILRNICSVHEMQVKIHCDWESFEKETERMEARKRGAGER